MRKINHLLFLVSFLVVYSLFACKKEKKIYTPMQFLTGRTWIADTITINPPVTYSQLSSADQQSYRNSIAWFNFAKLTLNDNGTVTSGGDYDFGFRAWRLVNNNLDIEMTGINGTKQILRNWKADAIRFSYTIQFNTSFDFTYVYK